MNKQKDVYNALIQLYVPKEQHESKAKKYGQESIGIGYLGKVARRMKAWYDTKYDQGGKENIFLWGEIDQHKMHKACEGTKS